MCIKCGAGRSFNDLKLARDSLKGGHVRRRVLDYYGRVQKKITGYVLYVYKRAFFTGHVLYFLLGRSYMYINGRFWQVVQRLEAGTGGVA